MAQNIASAQDADKRLAAAERQRYQQFERDLRAQADLVASAKKVGELNMCGADEAPHGGGRHSPSLAHDAPPAMPAAAMPGTT